MTPPTTLRVLLPNATTLRGVGLNDMLNPSFFVGTTMPTVENTGIIDVGALTPYDADIVTPRRVYIDTPGTVIADKDMGNIRLNIRTSGVRLLRNRWHVTNNPTGEPMVSTNTAGTGIYAEQCEIVNFHQGGFSFNGFEGGNIWMYRCQVMGTGDASRPNLLGNVKIEGSLLGYLGWWANEGVPYLNTGNQTHADDVQTQYGAGLILRGNALIGYPADWVGTGTPGSGSDTGNTGSWYTQAEAEAKRASIWTAMTDPAKSYDGLSHESGGTMTPLMLNRVQGPTAFNLEVTDNWFAGGVVQVNALHTALTNPLGIFKRNRHFNDAFYKVGGKSIGYRFHTGLTSESVPVTGPDINYYMDSGLAVPIVY